MKIRIRKLLCLWLALCVIVLSACGSADNTPEKLNQSTQNSNINQEEKLYSPDEENNKTNEYRSLNWKATPIGIPYDWTMDKPEIQLMTYKSTKQVIDELITISESHEWENNSPINVLKALSYPEVYFETYSLLFFHINVSLSCAYAINDVQYNNDRLVVLVEYLAPPSDSIQVSAFATYGVFLEIDEMIPPSTSVCLDIQIKEIAI